MILCAKQLGGRFLSKVEGPEYFLGVFSGEVHLFFGVAFVGFLRSFVNERFRFLNRFLTNIDNAFLHRVTSVLRLRRRFYDSFLWENSIELVVSECALLELLLDFLFEL